MLNIKIFYKKFIELYFYNLKENYGVSIKDFAHRNRSDLYEDFFDKFNNLVIILKTIKKANNELQRKRIYSTICHAENKRQSLVNIINELRTICFDARVPALFDKVGQVLGIVLTSAPAENISDGRQIESSAKLEENCIQAVKKDKIAKDFKLKECAVENSNEGRPEVSNDFCESRRVSNFPVNDQTFKNNEVRVLQHRVGVENLNEGNAKDSVGVLDLSKKKESLQTSNIYNGCNGRASHIVDNGLENCRITNPESDETERNVESMDSQRRQNKEKRNPGNAEENDQGFKTSSDIQLVNCQGRQNIETIIKGNDGEYSEYMQPITDKILEQFLDENDNLDILLETPPQNISKKEDSVPNIDMIDSLIFGNTSDMLLSSTIADNKENNLSSIGSTLIDISNNSSSVMENYIVLRKKIKKNKNKYGNKKACKKVIKNRHQTVFTHFIGEYEFSVEDFIYITNNFINKQLFHEVVPYLEDHTREKFKCFNNACPINYNSHRWNKAYTKLDLYARCLYFTKGCGRFKVTINILNNSIKVIIYGTKTFINHATSYKNVQIRAVRRRIAKVEMQKEKASNWRNKQLFKQNKDLRRIGNVQEVPSPSATRKMKSEQLRDLDRDRDMFIDLYKMRMDKSWSRFIQKISIPQEIYLFTKQQLMILHCNKNKVLKLSRNTLFFDATGSVVKKFENESKRVFLYSFIAHVRQDNESGILLPVAEALLSSHFSEDIERFQLALYIYCVQNNITWPICKRVCLDWSWASINAVNRAFNKHNKINTIEQYLSASYNLCASKKTKCNFVVIQICCVHFLRIAFKDIDESVSELKAIEYLKRQFLYAVNISQINIFFEWISRMLVITGSKYKTIEVDKALKLQYLCEEQEEIKFENINAENSQFNANYKKSPFFMRANRIYLKAMQKAATHGVKNKFYSERLCKLLMCKYAAFAPLWTNLLGMLVETKKMSRISNSPVESYFNIVKNVTLQGQRFVRPSEYVRHSYVYIQAKINEIETEYIEENKIQKVEKRKRVDLEEDVWRKTPKKVKAQINKNILYEKVLKQYSRLPRSLKDKRYVLLKFSNIVEKLRFQTFPPEIDLIEFNSLNPRKELYNNVLEIYIYIQIAKKGCNAYSTSCSDGENFFYTDNNDINLHLEQYKLIFVPILHKRHFTMVYINTQNKTFLYLNPTGDEENNFLDIFHIKTKSEKYTLLKWSHDKQDLAKDSYNCGVYVCLFVKNILEGKTLLNMENPDVYRQTMKIDFYDNADDMLETCFHCGSKISEATHICKQCRRAACDGCMEYNYQRISDNFICMFCNAK